jgi:hypothetical protein
MLERGQPHVLGDAWNVAGAVKEAFELTRHQFSVGQHFFQSGNF